MTASVALCRNLHGVIKKIILMTSFIKQTPVTPLKLFYQADNIRKKLQLYGMLTYVILTYVMLFIIKKMKGVNKL